jgi:hypothetical protein
MVPKLSYGFELEGAFSQEAIDKIKGVFKHDGSVTVEHDDIPFTWGSTDDCDAPEEFESPVFNSSAKLLDCLNKFTEANHSANYTCGLHLHVGVLRGTHEDSYLYRQRCEKLWGAFCNMDFVNTLYQAAVGFCKCQKTRLIEGDWAHNYFKRQTSAKDLIYDMREQNKYRFMHFHSQGTIEFRFIAPCEHKAENVAKVLDYVHSYLSATSSHERIIKVPLNNRSVAMNSSFTLDEEKPEVLVFKEKYGKSLEQKHYRLNVIDEEVQAFNDRQRRTPGYRSYISNVGYQLAKTSLSEGLPAGASSRHTPNWEHCNISQYIMPDGQMPFVAPVDIRYEDRAPHLEVLNEGY